MDRLRAGRVEPALRVVIAAGKDVQIFTKRQDGVIVFHRVDPFVAFGDGSERMPNVFLRCRAARSPGPVRDRRPPAVLAGRRPIRALPLAPPCGCLQEQSASSTRKGDWRRAPVPGRSPPRTCRWPASCQRPGRLKESSNLRRMATGAFSIGFIIHCSPHSLSVNSKHPQSGGGGARSIEQDGFRSPLRLPAPS